VFAVGLALFLLKIKRQVSGTDAGCGGLETGKNFPSLFVLVSSAPETAPTWGSLFVLVSRMPETGPTWSSLFVLTAQRVLDAAVLDRAARPTPLPRWGWILIFPGESPGNFSGLPLVVDSVRPGALDLMGWIRTRAARVGFADQRDWIPESRSERLSRPGRRRKT